MSERLGYDSPKLSRDEATELCVYHLRVAASLFQLVPDDDNQSLILEINRQCADDILGIDTEPMKLWATAILSAYEAMKDRD